MNKLIVLAILLFASLSWGQGIGPGGGMIGGQSPSIPNLTVMATEGSNIVTNGTFTTDLTGWAGANWAQSAGTALHTAGATTALTQAAATVTSGTTYKVVFDTTGRTAGSVTMSVGGVTGTARSTNATFTEYVTATATTALAFTPTTDFDGALDNVTLQALTDATGDLTVQGNLVVRSPSTFDSSITLNRGQLVIPNGAVGAPAISNSALTSGIYFDVNGNLFISNEGSRYWMFGQNIMYFGTAGDVVLYRAAANSLQVGVNDTTASAQTLKGADSTGAGNAGANLTLQGGTPGAGGTYGALLLQPSGGIIAMGTTASPASNAACTAGTFYWDASYIYICTATAVVKRVALTGGY